MEGYKEALQLGPAYGRDYATEWDARCAWFEGRDFKVLNGPYISARDRDSLREHGYRAVVIRFDGLARSTLVGLSRQAELDHAIAASRVREHASRMRCAAALSDVVERHGPLPR